MIGYVTLGTNDLDRAAGFYDALLAPIGAKRLWDMPRGIAWGRSEDTPILAVMKPFDGAPATFGNGVMVGLSLGNKEAVEAMHRQALALGGEDEGAIGMRGDSWYCGYFRDLDGNKLLAFCRV